MVRLNAFCASCVSASHSSRNIILNPPPSALVLAKSFTLFLTTSIPLSSLALVSEKFSLQASPNRSRARHIAAVVFPTPAGPAKSMCGMLFARTNADKRPTMASWPIIPERVEGRYFSVQISSKTGCDSVTTITACNLPELNQCRKNIP